jgi:hypothetical protein
VLHWQAAALLEHGRRVHSVNTLRPIILIVAGVLLLAAVIAWIASFVLVTRLVKRPSSQSRRRWWSFSCTVVAGYPIALLIFGVVALDIAVDHNVFTSNPGNNVLFALVIAVVGALLLGVSGWITAARRRQIIWTLDHALPQVGPVRTRFNDSSDSIRNGSPTESRDNIGVVLDEL